MYKINKKLLKELKWAATHKEHGYNLSGKEARQLLEAFGETWIPEVSKETTRDMAFRSFKAGLFLRFGKSHVSIDRESVDEKDGRTYQTVVVQVDFELGDLWPDETVEAIAKASGFSRFFEETGTGMGMESGCRDFRYWAKRGVLTQ